MNPNLAYYVVRYYSNFMTDVERRANGHLMGTMKATLGRDDALAQQEALGEKQYGRWVTDDPQVLALAKNGMQEFRVRTATRILADHSGEVFLNFCPRCHEIARTPRAQQCHVCGYDWHPAKPDHE